MWLKNYDHETSRWFANKSFMFQEARAVSVVNCTVKMASTVSMDFSDMFKATGGKKRNVKDESDVTILPVVDQENTQPNSESVDSVAYVKRHLASLNYDVSSIDLNKHVAKIMETMLSEVKHSWFVSSGLTPLV